MLALMQKNIWTTEAGDGTITWLGMASWIQAGGIQSGGTVYVCVYMHTCVCVCWCEGCCATRGQLNQPRHLPSCLAGLGTEQCGTHSMLQSVRLRLSLLLYSLRYKNCQLWSGIVACERLKLGEDQWCWEMDGGGMFAHVSWRISTLTFKDFFNSFYLTTLHVCTWHSRAATLDPGAACKGLVRHALLWWGVGQKKGFTMWPLK